MERRRPPKSKPEPGASLAARGLRLLARRDHTRRELATKLAPYVEDPAALERALDELTARGWLSEARVVDQVVHAKGARLGPAGVRHALTKRGVPEALIEPAVAELKMTELSTARALWKRKFGERASSASDEARQVRFLQSRGFSLGVAMRVVRGSFDDTLE